MDISTRMKSYEDNARLDKGAAIIRIDGKGFHTWTKKIGAERPFDSVVHECMVHATKKVAEEMQGFRLAYTQSDETTFLLSNMKEKEGAWFDYKVQKIASITSSLFTYYFNNHYELARFTRGYPDVPAFFDARAFSMPVEDAANVFVWRQQDWQRNSVQMLGHYWMGHRAMQGLNRDTVIKKLETDYNKFWGKLAGWKKYGTFVVPFDNLLLTRHEWLDYASLNLAAGLSTYIKEKE